MQQKHKHFSKYILIFFFFNFLNRKFSKPQGSRRAFGRFAVWVCLFIYFFTYKSGITSVLTIHHILTTDPFQSILMVQNYFEIALSTLYIGWEHWSIYKKNNSSLREQRQPPLSHMIKDNLWPAITLVEFWLGLWHIYKLAGTIEGSSRQYN